MLDSVPAVRKLDELRVILEQWTQENSIEINGQQLFPNIESCCVDWSTSLKPTVEVYEKTLYRKEWCVVRQHMRKGTPKNVLLEFAGKENILVPRKELGEISNPLDLTYLINHELSRMIHSLQPGFSWQMKYANESFRLVTDPIR